MSEVYRSSFETTLKCSSRPLLVFRHGDLAAEEREESKAVRIANSAFGREITKAS
jgi:hypothetical protein